MKQHFLKNLLFVLLLITYTVSGQTKTISGKIIDENGEPLLGASILIKKSKKGTSSDFDGNFKINAKATDILIVTYIGYDKKEVLISGKDSLTIILKPSAEALDEIVLIGYQKVRKKDVTGAVTSISAKQIEDIPVVTVSSLIATQSTGVQNITMSGAPGARQSLVIRGNTSLSGQLDANTAFSNPLYVIDGVQTSLEDLAGYNVSNVDFLASLNPNDIESIDILKDASAAAIYGSRGANGVIIITTKGGKALDKPEFSFSAVTGVSPKPNLVPMLLGAAERNAKWKMIDRWWLTREVQGNEVPMVLSDSLNPAFNNNVDYQKMFYQPGTNKQYNLSVRGGSEKSNYRFSLGYLNSEGVLKGTGFKRYNLSANTNFKVGSKFRNQFRILASITDNQTGQGNPYGGSFNLNATLPVSPTNLNSSLFAISDKKRKSLTGELTDKLNTDKEFKSTFSNFATLDLFDGLTLNSQLTYVYSSIKKNFYEPSTIRTNKDGFASYTLYNRQNLSSDLYLSYFKNFGGNHEVSAILGNKIDYNQYEDLGTFAVGFGSDAIKVINSRYTKDEISGYSDINSNALLSYFARATYKYKERYIFSGNFSIDGSSRFGTDVRWAKFPSASLAWIFSDEPFLKPILSDFVDFAKLKVTWGINGKQFRENFLRFGAYNLGYGGAAYWTNQMNVSSYAGTTGVVPNYNQIGNKKLSWENSEQWDIGLELDMFNRRLNFSFDAYHKQTDKLLFDVSLPGYSGYNRAKSNIAGVLNYGWEAFLTYHIFPRTNDLRLSFDIGLSRNENYVTNLPNGNRDYIGESGDYGYVVGRPLNLYKFFTNDYILDDLNQLPVNPYTGEPLAGKSAWAKIQPGFPIWKDLNGDYILNETHDYQLSREFSPIPDIQGSFNINLKYKAWYLQMYSQFSFGADIFNSTLNSYMNSYDRGGNRWAEKGLADLSAHTFWDKPGDGAAGVRFPALYPAVGSLGAFYRFRPNQSLWIESGDYWKITNASIGYTFSGESWMKNIGLNRLRIYGSVLNPYMWQRSKAVVDASLVNAKGYTFGNGYPQARTFSIGIDAKF
ncbi:SusC/RagA family TonB-linked outer membrane protein [Polaribacter cellanae]|uniref:SusC/RagA family TonB-linked outer membrane protein n=1 Tax=Polaribacter cellanae TaxID=2818493 RepID=A0A975CQ67_9FLAO|nr:SusC/RagA family TonB-linked outer membrane protein [Polaribacter cellanae]QTE23708.1 SusC/RagA family TonB-linked outer membrane protein [Polaribacter cellanae]